MRRNPRHLKDNFSTLLQLLPSIISLQRLGSLIWKSLVLTTSGNIVKQPVAIVCLEKFGSKNQCSGNQIYFREIVATILPNAVKRMLFTVATVCLACSHPIQLGAPSGFHQAALERATYPPTIGECTLPHSISAGGRQTGLIPPALETFQHQILETFQHQILETCQHQILEVSTR